MKVPPFLVVLADFVEQVETTKDLKHSRTTPEWREFMQAWSYWVNHPAPKSSDYYKVWWDLHDLVYANLFGKARQVDLYRRVKYIWWDMQSSGHVTYKDSPT